MDVPERLSVIGFDDVELARYAGLTTVAQPLEASGARGAELLLDGARRTASRAGGCDSSSQVRTTDGATRQGAARTSWKAVLCARAC